MANSYVHRLEALVTDTACGAGLMCTDTTRDRELSTTLRLVPRNAGPGARSARLWATGGGAYGLDLSDGYRTVNFAHDETDELEVLHQLVAVARECLLDRGVRSEVPAWWGRRRPFLEVVVDGEPYRLWGRAQRR